MQRDKILSAVYQALERSNALREPEQQLVCAEETTLYGSQGGLDSLGLVSLLLDVEEAVNAHTGACMVLADARAMAQQRNPFRDVRSLADYVVVRLKETRP